MYTLAGRVTILDDGCSDAVEFKYRLSYTARFSVAPKSRRVLFRALFHCTFYTSVISAAESVRGCSRCKYMCDDRVASHRAGENGAYTHANMAKENGLACFGWVDRVGEGSMIYFWRRSQLRRLRRILPTS